VRPHSMPPAPPPSRATTTGVAGPSPLYRRGLPPRRLAADPRPQGVDADASVFEGASPSVRALWNARAAAAPMDMPRVRIPGGDAPGPDGADAESPAPGEARLPRVQAAGGGQLRVPMGLPVADAGVAAAAAVGDDDIEHDSVLGAPPETWCDTWPGGRNPAASSVAEATAIQATMQRVSIGGEAAQPQMPHGAGSPAGTGSGGVHVYTLLMNAAKADAAEHASRMRLPPGYTVRELNCFEEAPELHALNKVFAAEDDRIGILPARGPCGNAHGCVSLLVYGETARAVGYALHYPNAVPSWRGAGAAAADDMSALPPRLAHLYILPSHRRAGLGTALLAWWRARHAATVALFAVDTPNDAMTRCLTRLGCAPATQASGFDAQAVHYVGAPHQQPGGRQ
jgi:GNAT superfamily N-acetyltransferase